MPLNQQDKELNLDFSSYFWQGEKVRLRPLKVEAARQCYDDSLDSPARQFLQLGVELPSSVEQQKKFLEKYADCKTVDGTTIFAIENLNGEYVGGISLHGRSEKNGTFSFGVVISKNYRRKGYAEEAIRILLKYGFWERRYQKCNSACVEGNLESVKLHEKLGFKQEGIRRRQFFFNGKFYDEILFGLIREEFDSQENKLK
ncbi:MAG: hypothetical protein APR63_02820 [Desulfuromonas sp. SDB]|nr:MAG: hypothetical protein APR63_02820 [Desulfuromonas sp. SDB]